MTLKESIDNLLGLSIVGETDSEIFQEFKKKSYNGEIDTSKYRIVGADHAGGKKHILDCEMPYEVISDATFPVVLQFKEGINDYFSSMAVVSLDIKEDIYSRGVLYANYNDVLKRRTYSFPRAVRANDAVFIIEQLQGSTMSFGIDELRWEKMLVKVIEDWAIESGFDNSYIISAKAKVKDMNRYMNPSYNKFTLERAKMRHDVTAKRMGYKLRGNLWVKELKN